ncbi:MAG: UDP-4-amino-4,6-dideoxy-N-acetyl-beta-L-altrosamine N-acetyltransferase [Deltaproteobacteria bacterium]|nr:UDP-4-amino-4,6-dideoxy-N-acetyl-beta-L-altrosamine N-acetyltransferase [Deltaproteobacteria bacterium]
MYKLVPLNDDTIDIILKWRNSPEIRKFMFTRHIISKEEHYLWYEKIKNDPTTKIFTFNFKNVPIGVISFYNIDTIHKTAYWSFYSGDTSQRGRGALMEYYAINFAFDVLCVEKLCCEVLSNNLPVVSFHRKHGFEIEGIFRKQHYYLNEFLDIYRLALFKKDWEKYIKNKLKNSSNRNDKIKVGSAYSLNFSITKGQILDFVRLTQDNNLIHTDEKTAEHFGFNGVVSPGLLTSAIFSRIFGSKFPGDGTIYLSQSFFFIAPVYSDMELLATVKIVSLIGRKAIAETLIHNQANELLIKGEATILIPDEYL